MSYQRARRAGGSEARACTDPEALDTFAHNEAVRLVKDVAYNQATSPGTLEFLAQHPDPTVRNAVAKHAATPDRSLRLLALDTAAFVRRTLTFRPALPSDALSLLATDIDPVIRKGAAYHGLLSTESAVVLSHDTDPEVRRAVARSPALPDAERIQMIADTDPRVRVNAGWQLRKNLESVVAPGEDGAVGDGTGAPCGDSRTPEQVAALLQMARSEDGRLRRQVSRMRALPDSVYEALLADDDQWVRCNLVDSPTCPVWVLNRLATDPTVEVRMRVAAHLGASEQTWGLLAAGRAGGVAYAVLIRAGEEWLATHPVAKIRMWAVQFHSGSLERFVADPDEAVRTTVAKLTIEPELLERLAIDPKTSVRRATSLNPRIGAVALSRLVEDRVASVREAAARRFLNALNYT